MTVIPLLFPQSTVTGVARVIAKVIVGGRSHVDYDGFVHHSCYHFGALGDVTVILLFFGPPLSTVRRGGKGDREGDRGRSLLR